jgi:hypothetical protein
MTHEFKKWWYDNVLYDNVFVKDNSFINDSPAFWAWEGWHAAIAVEREACAKMVEPLDESLADAIRARGQQ